MDHYHTIVLFATVTLVLLIVLHVWQKIWLYYYSLQFPGPKVLPTSLKLIRAVNNDTLVKILYQIAESQNPVFKMWFANELFIMNSQPEDLEILLNKFLNKGHFYYLFNDLVTTNILTSSGYIWKERRKQIIPSFNSKILTTFHPTFVKYAKTVVKRLNRFCGQEQTDLFDVIWGNSLDTSMETIFDYDPTLLKDRHAIVACFTRFEEILIERTKNFWLLVDIIFRMSHFKKELTSISRKLKDFGEKILEMKRMQMDVGITDDLRKKRFLNLLVHLNKQQIISKEELLDETVLMLGVASETTSITLTNVMLVLALYPEVQNKLLEEICMVSTIDKNEDLLFEEVISMDYLERVIKETMRLLSPVPFIFRSIDRNFRLGSLLYPAGSTLFIPMGYLHRRPDLWPDPLRFDPDRFLPEEVTKRHRCAYIPFSFGSRNCAGLNYAMRSMKVMLVYIVKHFKITALNYSSLEELKVKMNFVAIPTGYRVLLERRTNANLA